MNEIQYSFRENGRLDDGRLNDKVVYSGWPYAVYCYSQVDKFRPSQIAVFRLKELKPVNK